MTRTQLYKQIFDALVIFDMKTQKPACWHNIQQKLLKQRRIKDLRIYIFLIHY